MNFNDQSNMEMYQVWDKLKKKKEEKCITYWIVVCHSIDRKKNCRKTVYQVHARTDGIEKFLVSQADTK